MKSKTIALCLTIFILIFGLVACGNLEENDETAEENLFSFYDVLQQQRGLLDNFADEIYAYWYSAIYKGDFDDDIDLAITTVFEDNQRNIKKIQALDVQLKKLYKSAKKSRCEEEVKDAMKAYNDYYSFVMEVSGSFEGFSKEMQGKKKAFATALKNLQMEL